MSSNVQIDFQKIIDYAQNKRQHIEDKEFEDIFKIGVYHGLFNEENFGEHDRRNSVYLFLSTLRGLYEKNTVEAPKEQVTFHVKINGGPEQTITTKTGQYRLAALSALAMLEYDNAQENVVEIWIPSLLADYGPYFYVFDGFQVNSIHK